MRQKLGQHFLINPAISEVIATALDLTSGGAVVEIGPGHGELTQVIADKIRQRGGAGMKIVAIEKDPELASQLQRHFEKSDVKIVEGDVLKELKGISSVLKTSYKIVGNIPYYVTGHLLRHLSELERKPELAVLMIQKEVAERIVAVPPRMNRLAAAVQFWAEPRLLLVVPRNNFDPPPEVDSAILLLQRRRENRATEASAFYSMIRSIFAQPRKTILNNLKKEFSARDIPSEEGLKLLERCGIDGRSRPQDLSVATLVNLAREMQ